MIGAPERAMSFVSDAARPPLVDRADQPAGDQQAPGRGVDERRGRLADMGAPLAAADLVGDQRVAGRRVRDAQQRLGQAHQRDAFLAGKRVFAHQPLHQPAGRAGARRPSTSRRASARASSTTPRRQRRPGDELGHDFGLGRAMGGVDLGALVRRGLEVLEKRRKRRRNRRAATWRFQT